MLLFLPIIGLFKIESEESVGSGVRRIEAVTAQNAYLALKKNEETLQTISDLLKIKNKAELIYHYKVLIWLLQPLWDKTLVQNNMIV